MPELLEDGDRRTIEAGSLRLVFDSTGTRWSHRLEQRREDLARPRVLAVSVEGDPERDDPSRVVSPAFQQLQFQREGSTIRALLVGQSGRHHFSAVFEVEETGSGLVSIRVDVADRCRGVIEALASTYTVGARSDDLIDASPSLGSWQFGPARLDFAASEPTRVALAEAGKRATQIQALAGDDRASSTRRFLYLWRWDPAWSPTPILPT